VPNAEVNQRQEFERSAAYEARGWEFESLRARHILEIESALETEADIHMIDFRPQRDGRYRPIHDIQIFGKSRSVTSKEPSS